jgi:hypothetical protein
MNRRVDLFVVGNFLLIIRKYQLLNYRAYSIISYFVFQSLSVQNVTTAVERFVNYLLNMICVVSFSLWPLVTRILKFLCEFVYRFSWNVSCIGLWLTYNNNNVVDDDALSFLSQYFIRSTVIIHNCLCPGKAAINRLSMKNLNKKK